MRKRRWRWRLKKTSWGRCFSPLWVCVSTEVWWHQREPRATTDQVRRMNCMSVFVGFGWMLRCGYIFFCAVPLLSSPRRRFAICSGQPSQRWHHQTLPGLRPQGCQRERRQRGQTDAPTAAVRSNPLPFHEHWFVTKVMTFEFPIFRTIFKLHLTVVTFYGTWFSAALYFHSTTFSKANIVLFTSYIHIYLTLVIIILHISCCVRAKLALFKIK